MFSGNGRMVAGKNSIVGYERELQEVVAAVERSASAALCHIAIVAEPMAGRTTLVSEIRRCYGERVHYLSLEFVVQESALPDFSSLSGDIILIDNCHFLATRVIGGFDVLDAFLRMQITSRKIVITTWNSYSWQYLSAVMNIGAYFPAIISLQRMDTPLLKQVILSRYPPGGIRFFNDGAAERSMFFSVIHKTMKLPFSSSELTVPWIKLNFTVMLRRLPRRDRVQVSMEDVVFEKINRIAGGNPGVATVLWEASLKDNAISPGSISEMPYSISLDTNESFILSVILSMDSLHEKDLAAIAGSEMDIRQVLYRLVQQGLVLETAGYYSIPPFALSPVIEYLKKTRRLW
jgi:hypothetical protein